MSVTQQQPFNFRPAATESRGGFAGELDALEASVEADAVTFTCVHENSNIEIGALWLSGITFMLFEVSILPAMELAAFGNALLTIIGLLVLVMVGLIVQARVRTTQIRLSTRGIRVEQGTMLDREAAEIAWKDLASVELEPVDAKSETKGMQLEFRPVEGEPVRVLPGIGVGDLSVVRQAVQKARRGSEN